MAAAGLAVLVQHLSGAAPAVREEPTRFVVEVDRDLDLDALDCRRLCLQPGYPYVKLSKDDVDAPGTDVIDYRKERERLLNQRKLRQQYAGARRGRARLTEEERLSIQTAGPMAGWMSYQCLNVLQAFGPYNSLHREMRAAEPGEVEAAVRLKLAGLARAEDPRDVPTRFSPKVSAVQAFVPTVGKGINRPKPDSTANAGLPSGYVDWFEEYLRYLGVASTAAAHPMGKDVKVVVMTPGDLSWDRLTKLAEWFKDVAVGVTPVKIDVLTVIRLARFLLENWETSTRWYVPSDVVSAVETAHFKSLGNSRALLHTTRVGLPGWFPIREAEDTAIWIGLLDEHARVVRSLNEDNGDEADLLCLYREFISATSWERFLEFAAGYGIHLMRVLPKRGMRVPSLSQEGVTELLQKAQCSYADIVSDPGFRDIARAMRQATISEQYHKANGNQQYEIRYGLFQEIKQKARFRQQLVEAVSRFITDFNYEAARKMELSARGGTAKGLRIHRPVKADSFTSFVALLDRYHSAPEMVGLMLIAYASCAAGKRTEGTGAPSEAAAATPVSGTSEEEEPEEEPAGDEDEATGTGEA